MHAPRAILAAGLIAATAATLAACGSGSDGDKTAAAAATTETTSKPAESIPVITVQAQGRVEGTPDLMTIQIGVQTTAETADEALSQANEQAARVIAVLKAGGVAARDIQTSDLSLWPNFDDKGLRVVGYTVTNGVTAKLRDLDKAGEVIDNAAAFAGDAIRLNGVSFSIEDTSALVAVARKDAVARAVKQAGELADAAGVKLGRIRSIDETNPIPPTPIEYNAAMALPASDRAVPIERGSQQLTLDVTMVFEIDEG